MAKTFKSMLRLKSQFPWQNQRNDALLNWVSKQPNYLILNSNLDSGNSGSFQTIISIGILEELRSSTGHAFSKLTKFRAKVQDYVFGYLAYDLKNELFTTSSSNVDELDFDDLRFVQGEKLIFIKENQIEFLYPDYLSDEASKDLEQILTFLPKESSGESSPLSIQSRIDKTTYIDRVNTLKKHIQRGDVYEANFCQEFYVENASIDPFKVYENLNTISEAPFSALMKWNEQVLICSSPERFIQKKGTQVISQPIKGTAKRGATKQEDLQIKEALKNDQKERAENVMIVDLVRNDLSHIADKGSVQVDELCEVYSFKQVHQLISTIRATVSKALSPEEIIQALFPMGSMTGAPKLSALNLIEKLEESKRGIYSGALGYISPDGDFDFNVVIRSILVNLDKSFLSFSVGSAITNKSEAESEYEECLLKAKAMYQVLNGNS